MISCVCACVGVNVGVIAPLAVCWWDHLHADGWACPHMPATVHLLINLCSPVTQHQQVRSICRQIHPPCNEHVRMCVMICVGQIIISHLAFCSV